MRVIFDLSSLHGENLDRLRASKLSILVKRHQLVICHTPIFLEEVLQGALSNRHVDRWPDVLGWAIDLVPEVVFLDKLDIWREELVVGAGPNARHTYPRKRTRRYLSHEELIGTLRELATTRSVDELIDEATRSEVDVNNAKKAAQRRLGQEIRESVAQKARRAGGAAILRDLPFWKVRALNPHLWGCQLASFLGPIHEDRVRDLWIRDPGRSPFYSAFAESIDYWAYHVGCHPDVPIDQNAQMDFEQLCYLVWADLIVSNDTRFFKLAFDAIWRPKKKILMSTDEFLDLVSVLA